MIELNRLVAAVTVQEVITLEQTIAHCEKKILDESEELKN
jgi:hypothetical protein